MSASQIGIHLFLQLCIIICTCRGLGWLGRRFLGQTQVFMEMVAGVVLGPSLLGAFLPAWQQWLFPQILPGASGVVTHPNMVILYALAQVGLVLYMFVIGLEFDLSLLRGRAKSAGLVSGAGIIAPFAMGALLVPSLMKRGDLFAADLDASTAWLFVGASISITAFPMLARILYERGIAGTGLGTLTLAAGSVDDAIAWCLLALVLALFKKTPETVVVTVGLGAAYGILTLTVGRRALAWFGRAFERTGELSSDVFTCILALLMLCAYFTDLIGIYAVFGAFILGAAMPKGELSFVLSTRIEHLTTSLFLPMFFVYSGLNTKIGLLDSVELWGVAGGVVLLSTLGKGGACMLAARLSGEDWRQSAVVGTLMNARGLMELILLNIGLERGVITPTFFAIMVIMAVVTTGMTSPLYALLTRNLVLEGARSGVRRPPMVEASA